ncbi:MAG: IS3 family transposase [Desulfobacula sp.]|nr:IS3 family transposase [Desulfobacula sp.]
MKKSRCHLLKGEKSLFGFIEKHRTLYKVQEMCSTLGVSPSGYYKWRQKPMSNRSKQNQILLSMIRTLFEKSRHTYGPYRMMKALQKQGVFCGVNRIRNLMQSNGIKPKRRTKHKKTTRSNHNRGYSPNIVKQVFTAQRPNQLWTSDVCYIKTLQGWIYLCVVLDVFSRRIVGWSMNKRQTDRLIVNAFTCAWWSRKPDKGLTFHSDRGSQYCSQRFRQILQMYNCTQSMSDTGNCFDNAITETFFKTLRAELTYHCNFSTRQEAKTELFKYIEIFYNKNRLHSAVDYCAPEEWEVNYWSKIA